VLTPSGASTLHAPLGSRPVTGASTQTVDAYSGLAATAEGIAAGSVSSEAAVKREERWHERRPPAAVEG